MRQGARALRRRQDLPAGASEHMSTDPSPEASPVVDTRKPSRGGAVGRVARRAGSGAWNDDIFTESASAAFWQTLSLPPLLLGLFGILGYVGGWFGPNTVANVEQWIVETTSGCSPAMPSSRSSRRR